jgi:hypothetical protein
MQYFVSIIIQYDCCLFSHCLTTTSCNCAACHQYEQYKKSIVYNTSNDNDINYILFIQWMYFHTQEKKNREDIHEST